MRDYEPQVKYKDYRAEVTQRKWTCGDGCCSDTWYSYIVINNYGFIVEEVGEMDRSSGFSSAERAIEIIKERYGSAIEINVI